MTHKNKITPAT